jgi:hypothetical protein
VKLTKEEMKRKRRLHKDKKDVKVRREWGSQSGELLVINENYIPEPEMPLNQLEDDNHYSSSSSNP